jgi:MFS family permease
MHRRWLILFVLTFARTAIAFQFQSLAALSPFLIEQFQLNYATLGIVIGLYLLPGVVVALPGGMIAHRFGDKRIACLGLVAMTVGGLIIAGAVAPTALTAGRLISGTGAVLLNVLVTKMVTDWFEGANVVTALGILVASWPLGNAAALVVLPQLAIISSWREALLAAALFSAIAAVLVGQYFRSAETNTWELLPSVWHFPPIGEFVLVLLTGLIWAFYNVSFIIILAFGPDFLISQGWHTEAASAMVSTMSWMLIVGVPFGAWLADRIGRPDLTIIACSIASALLLWALVIVGPSLLLFVTIGLLIAPPAGVIMSLPGEATPPERRGFAMGVYFSCFYAGIAAFTPLVGFARDLSGDARAPLWFAGCMLLLTASTLLQFRYLQTRMRREPPPSRARTCPDRQPV